MSVSSQSVDLSPAHPDAGPAPLALDLTALGHFRAKMAEQALGVNVMRMMFDRPYAFDRIALAHTRADQSLQRLALQLFAQYTKSEDAKH